LLKYRAPDLIAEQIGRLVPARDIDVLDLGCGTGLLGARLRMLARSLTGVDLSANMIEQARRRNIYDRLVRADLISNARSSARRRASMWRVTWSLCGRRVERAAKKSSRRRGQREPNEQPDQAYFAACALSAARSASLRNVIVATLLVRE
jgi:SAM-dependent methyltransferase